MVTSNFRKDKQEANDLAEVETKEDFRDDQLYTNHVCKKWNMCKTT